ncbi:response regulator, partial [Turicimonas muris]
MKQPHLVLLVDDHSLITTAMSALLKSMYPEVQIYTGSSARDARELANKFGDSADLMILDLCLPDSSGTGLLEQLLSEYPALKILVLSGVVDPDSILKSLSAG